MADKYDDSRQLRCSFCGKPQSQVKRLVAGPGVYICDECVEMCMTGEITLRGKVLPVGGIREKVLAAHRAGIKKVLLPRENEPDIDDIPSAVRKQLEFVLIDNVGEALDQALVK